MDLLSIITVLIIISAVFSYLNVRFIKLPGTIGVVAIAVVISILMLIAGETNVGMANAFKDVAENINFSNVLLNVMLGLLLFASALHFDYKELKKQRLPVLLLSTLGVLVSTGVFAVLLYGYCQAFTNRYSNNLLLCIWRTDFSHGSYCRFSHSQKF